MNLFRRALWLYGFLAVLAGPLRAADYSGQVVGDGVGDGDTRRCGYRADCVVRPPQTPPRGDALALRLALGSASTGGRDWHPTRCGPGPAHTLRFSGGGTPSAAIGG